jgi:hypothetical protein
MSLFQVQLNNNVQGKLDLNPATGLQFETSVQRTAYITSCSGKIMELADGAEFYGSNYYKQFVASPVGTANEDTSFLSVVEDDGSVYVEGETASIPLVTAVTTVTTSFVTAVDYITNFNGVANFLQITNNAVTAVNVQLNGSTAAVFSLDGSATQVFNSGDLHISSVAFSAATAASASIQIIAGVKVSC